MRPDSRFVNLDWNFWGAVRLISQDVGYTSRARIVDGVTIPKSILVPTRDQILNVYDTRNISLPNENILQLLEDYFQHRSNILLDASNLLQDYEDAVATYHRILNLRSDQDPYTCHQPRNKQRGEMAGPAYFTCSINMLIENAMRESSNLNQIDWDPRSLAVFSDQDGITGVMSRRLDGAYPSTIGPVCVWEIKEYYHTTTFGSRIADGVYETGLDGFEINAFTTHNVQHILFVDSRRTWWEMGRSYMCRLCDLLHMGLVSEVIWGREIETRIPAIVSAW